jgi:TetR/AcrR family transcriptional repressor of nem operon
MSGTREKIIELGENLIRTKGYNAFSYQDISKELGIRNAAVHYYFSTKENLGTSIVKTNIQRFDEMIDNMNARGFGELKQLDTFVKIYIKSYREHKLCIIGALSPAANTLGETTKNELIKMTDIILKWLTGILASGKEKRVFSYSEEPNIKATLILSNLVASLQLSNVINDLDYKNICQSIVNELKP